MRDSLCDLLQHAALVARAVVWDHDDESGTYPSQARLITRIKLDGTSTVGALARDLGVTHVAVSRMVARFERYGYVQPRIPSRRGTPVVLTRLGISARNLALPMGDVERALTRGMSDAEIAQLKRLLGLVIRARPRRRTTHHASARASSS